MQIYTDLVLLFKDIKIIYENLNFDPETKWIKIKIFFIKNDENKIHENYFYYKTKNTLTVQKFYNILKENVILDSRNFPKDIRNYKFLLIIDIINF